MDKNKDGVVTIDEFIESCQKVSIQCSVLNVYLLAISIIALYRFLECQGG